MKYSQGSKPCSHPEEDHQAEETRKGSEAGVRLMDSGNSKSFGSAGDLGLKGREVTDGLEEVAIKAMIRALAFVPSVSQEAIGHF